MNFASDEARNTVAEWIGDALGFVGNVFVWVFGDLAHATWGLGVIVLVLAVWRVSLVFGPQKVCWRCKGSGHVGGLLGGRRRCSHCDGGLRNRVGGK